MEKIERGMKNQSSSMLWGGDGEKYKQTKPDHPENLEGCGEGGQHEMGGLNIGG